MNNQFTEGWEKRKSKRKEMTLEKAKKLLEEEYEKAKREVWINFPLAYALYQVWKMADEERSKQ